MRLSPARARFRFLGGSDGTLCFVFLWHTYLLTAIVRISVDTGSGSNPVSGCQDHVEETAATNGAAHALRPARIGSGTGFAG
jgi:hypothetical protein